MDDTNNPNYRVDLNSLLDNTRDRFSNWSVEQYQWQKGDRIRVLGKVLNDGSFFPLTELYDTEIIGVFNDTDGATEETAETKEWLYFQKKQDFDLNPTSLAIASIVILLFTGSDNLLRASFIL